MLLKIRYITTFFLFFGLTFYASCQDVMVNSEGRKILVYPDGSWKYYDEEKQKGELDLSESKTIISEKDIKKLKKIQFDLEKSHHKAVVLQSKEKSAYAVIDHLQNKLLDLEEEIEEKKIEGSKSEIRELKISYKLLKRDEKNAIKEYENINDEYSKTEKEISDLSKSRDKILAKIRASNQFKYIPSQKQRDQKSEESVASTEKTAKEKTTKENRRDKKRNELEQVKNNIQKSEPKVSKAKEKEEVQWEDPIIEEPVKKEKEFVKVKTEEDEPSDIITESEEIDTNLPLSKPKPANTSKVVTNVMKAPSSYYRHNVKDDKLLNPPFEPCEVVFEGKDEFTGANRKEIGKMKLFSYTPDNLLKYMTEEDYLNCEGNLTRLEGGIVYLNLYIKIKSKNAQREYGVMDKGNAAIIKMINGDNVNLINRKTDQGRVDQLNGETHYRLQFGIDAKAEKTFSYNEIDKIRLFWSTGYEDYDVYFVDFFQNQFACLR